MTAMSDLADRRHLVPDNPDGSFHAELLSGQTMACDLARSWGVSMVKAPSPETPWAFIWPADVNCEDAAALEEGGALGPVFGNNICAYDFGSFFALQAEESLRNTHVTGDYDVTDTLEIYFEFANTTSRFDRLNSLNPNAPILTIGVDHFGNIEDAFRRGIEVIPVGNQTRLIGGKEHLIGSSPLGHFHKDGSIGRARSHRRHLGYRISRQSLDHRRFLNSERARFCHHTSSGYAERTNGARNCRSGRP